MSRVAIGMSAFLAAAILLGCSGRSPSPTPAASQDPTTAASQDPTTIAVQDSAPAVPTVPTPTLDSHGRAAASDPTSNPLRNSAAFSFESSAAQPDPSPSPGVAMPASEGPATSNDILDLPETNYYEIRVPQGRMIIRIYDETPRHRDNFKKLVEEGFYDGTTFHRVIEGFMIQGGDPNSRDGDPYNDGQGDPGYTQPAEFVPHRYHKRGAVAAARRGDAVNPERRSSGSQFYIVQGSVLDGATLDRIERAIRTVPGTEEFTFTDEMRRTYEEVGGAPNLDGQYTVFGEVVEGFDVLDALASVPTPRKSGSRTELPLVDRPLQPVAMTIRPLSGYAP